MKMSPRMMAVMLPVMCVLTAVLLLLAVPLSLVAMVVLLVKPDIAGRMQAETERRLVRQMFGRMTRKAKANA